MHLCVAGWIDGKKVGYPICFPSVKCGDNHVGVVQYKDPDEKTLYDAYCYRIKGTSWTYEINVILSLKFSFESS